MLKKIKLKLMLFLFVNWVRNETDLNKLKIPSKMCKDREIQITGIKPVLGFRSHSTQLVYHFPMG